MKFTHAILVVLSATMFISCASKKPIVSRAQLCNDHYTEITGKFEGNPSNHLLKEELSIFLSRCMGTIYMEDAQYMLAQLHFNLKEYVRARGEYDIFMENFPSSDRIETAMYHKALASALQPYVEGRDESNTRQARIEFGNFVSLFPLSAKRDSAEYHMNRMMERMALRDYNIARLYLRMKEPQAAAIYLKDFIAEYPDSDLYESAITNLIQCYIRLEQFDQAQFYLDRYRNDPILTPTATDVRRLQAELDRVRNNFDARLRRQHEENQWRENRSL
jgi:outer membrane protein assembly factor BamD